MNLFSYPLRTLICLIHVLLFVLGTAALVGCSRSRPAPRTRATAKPDDTPTPSKMKREANTLRILAFANYISPKTVPSFMEQKNFLVEIESYESNEEFDKKWKGGEGDYDLLVVMHDKLAELLENEQAARLDKKAIPNLKHVDPKLLGSSSDMNNTFTIPFVFQPMLALAIRTDHVTKPVKGLEILFDEQYRGKIAIGDNGEQVVATYLLYLGLTTGAVDDASLAKVKELLLKQRPLLQEFAAAPLLEKLEKGDVWVALDALANLYKLVGTEQKNLRLVFPETGVPVWVDSLVVVKDAPMDKAAHAFINHLLSPEMSLLNAQETGLATVNIAARAKLDAKVREDRALYPQPPPKATALADWMFHSDLEGPVAKKIEALWKEVKEAKK